MPEIFIGNVRGPTGPQGQPGKDGSDGVDGKDGVTFTPHVDSNGDLSWTNDQGLANPTTVNIRGPQGEQGLPGVSGSDGASGKDGVDGKDGLDGSNGATFKPTVNANGDLSWTNDKGLANPETVNIKGPKGDAGQDGKAFTFSDFTPEQLESLKVKGDKGDPGVNGVDGKDGVAPSVSFRYDQETGLLYYSVDGFIDGNAEVW